jgi:hypothetical protein
MKYYTSRINVTNRINLLVFLHSDYFRGNEARSTAPIVYIRFLFSKNSKTQVYNNGIQRILLFKDDVLELNVSVSYIPFMKVG